MPENLCSRAWSDLRSGICRGKRVDCSKSFRLHSATALRVRLGGAKSEILCVLQVLHCCCRSSVCSSDWVERKKNVYRDLPPGRASDRRSCRRSTIAYARNRVSDPKEIYIPATRYDPVCYPPLPLPRLLHLPFSGIFFAFWQTGQPP